MKSIRFILSIALLFVVLQACKKEVDGEVFTITLESNGGMNIAPIRVRSGDLIPQNRLFPNPIITDGGTFDGWYADSELVQKFDFNTKITENMTLYAKWLYKTYPVSFVMNGAGDKAPIDVIEGRTLEVGRPDWDGKVFVGWYRDAGLKQLYNMNTKVISEMTLYARWENPSPPEWFAINANGVLEACFAPAGTAVVVVPEGVKVIGDWFVLASGLNAPGKPGFPTGKAIKEFILPQSLERIGTGSFKFAAIESVIIPPLVKELPPASFEGCDQLMQFVFAPNSTFEKLVSSGGGPVLSSTSLEYIVFPPTLVSVGMYTLSGCNALKTVTFERSESPVIFYDHLPGGGVWLFEAHFPTSIRMPEEVKEGFLAGIRTVMQDYEFNRWKDIVEGY